MHLQAHIRKSADLHVQEFLYIYVYITEKLFMTLKASEEKRKFN